MVFFWYYWKKMQKQFIFKLVVINQKKKKKIVANHGLPYIKENPGSATTHQHTFDKLVHKPHEHIIKRNKAEAAVKTSLIPGVWWSFNWLADPPRGTQNR